jgi:hypothetical protein
VGEKPKAQRISAIITELMDSKPDRSLSQNNRTGLNLDCTYYLEELDPLAQGCNAMAGSNKA